MERKIDCPFCGKPKHMYVNDAKGVYYCQKCKKHGKIGHIGKVRTTGTIESHVSSPPSLKGLRPLVPEDGLFWDYAKHRRALQFRDRLYMSSNFPEYLIMGLPLKGQSPNWFFGRRLLLAGPRYRYFNNTKGMICRSFTGIVKEAVVVEGFFDLCNVCEHFPTISTLGKAWDKEKIDKILSCVKKKLWIALDNDAFKDSFLLVCELSNKIEVELLHSDVVKDPGDGADWILSKVLKGKQQQLSLAS